MTNDELLDMVRQIALAMPEVSERLSHGAPSFFIREKKTLCNVHNDHHGAGWLALWVPAPQGVQDELVRLEPDRFFVPPYVGPRGWVGLRLDIEPDPDEIKDMLVEAYRTVAPKTLVRALDDQLANHT